MRHGDAPYINGERQISESGREDIEQMTEWLVKHLQTHSVELEHILVSPVLRAQQTADILEPALQSCVNYSWTRGAELLLKPESEPQLVIPYVEALSGNILLISHMPLVSNLWAGWLAGESQYFPTSSIGSIELVADNQDKQEASNNSFKTRRIHFKSPE